MVAHGDKNAILRVNGLPEPVGNQVYEVWLMRGTQPMPVSLFNVRSDGSGAAAIPDDLHAGDQVLVYHTGDQKAVVGWATVVSAPYPDPKKGDEKLVVIDLKAHRRLPRPVTLAQIKADKTFADLPIVRQGRLSVSPVTAPQWKRVLQLSGMDD